MAYNPERWLETLERELQNYINTQLNNAVHDPDGNPVGLNIYETVMEFPGPSIDSIRKMPLRKTLIHFAIDDMDSRVVGLGDNIFAQNYDEVTGTVTPQEARVHRVNFDVGIWATDVSGGTTSRVRAYQILMNALVGSEATKALLEFSQAAPGEAGIELLSFRGGHTVTETVNDVNVHRIVGAELEVRVFSRTPLPEPLPAIEGVTVEEITQVPMLTILGGGRKS